MFNQFRHRFKAIRRDEVRRVLFQEENVEPGDQNLAQALGVFLENHFEAVNLERR